MIVDAIRIEKKCVCVWIELTAADGTGGGSRQQIRIFAVWSNGLAVLFVVNGWGSIKIPSASLK